MSQDLGYYRFPTLHENRLVFVADDDLWTVSLEGGRAERLTNGRGPSIYPRFSPDGKWIAFAGREEGNQEIYIIPSGGGTPECLTHFGTVSYPSGWVGGSRAVLVTSNVGQPFPQNHHIYEVPRNGTPFRQLPLGPAREVAKAPRGSGVVIARNSQDLARWKRYRGGTAGNLWIDPTGKGRWKPLIELPGNLAAPMWIGRRIYFLSDHEGFGNLYSCLTSGKDLCRHTDHQDFYARFPSTDGSRIVYHAGADIYLFDPEGGAKGRSRRVSIEVTGPRTQTRRRFISGGRHLEDFDLHPEGHSICVTMRGRIATMGLWEGPSVIRSSLEPGSGRCRLGRWLSDGKTVIAVTDRYGEESLIQMPSGGPESRIRLRKSIGRATGLWVAPSLQKNLVALTNHRNELLLIDLKTQKTRQIDKSEHGAMIGVAWSPDSRWIAYGFRKTSRSCCLKLFSVSSGKKVELTTGDFRDCAPSFDPSGKYLFFNSFRQFDPVYDHQVFDLGFPRGARPHVILLQKNLASPFLPVSRAPQSPLPPSPSLLPSKIPSKEKKKKIVKIDLDGIQDRILAFPIADGRYAQVIGISGKMMYTIFPIDGALKGKELGSFAPPRASLFLYNFGEQKSEVLMRDLSSVRISADAKTMAVGCGRRIRVLGAGRKPDKSSAKAGRVSGWIDLTRLRIPIDPVVEWKQMFAEAWRLQRDQFWTENMSGVDWDRVRDLYAPLVDRVATRAEFSDLLWEMQGELGTSHAYELGGDYRPTPGYFHGFLGANFKYEPKAKAWIVERMIRGDAWNNMASSSLLAPGLGVRDGDQILEVAGRKTSRKVSPRECLLHMAGQEIEIVVRTGSRGKKRRVVVKTLRGEFTLRYREWVETNRQYVHQVSQGRVGYLHIPDMGPRGYSEFHRYFPSEMDHEGLIVDVRWNGGGHVSPLLLEKLLRRRVGYDISRWSSPDPYPLESPSGPMAALTNEFAGSDGDIFSHCFKLYGLGPLIGKRTWGGVIGIFPRHSLVDGTVTTQPEFSFWFEDVGWGVENYGTEPDIEVETLPQDHVAGKDPQLDCAIKEVLNQLPKRKPRKMKFEKRPDRGAPKLPRKRR
ncbi:MAG: PDZ domain-containing protein [Planctomycetota bacterium]|jgi:tricorn protease|nr:PDZ domain-containing protein [Planctomycetota bacterium]